MTRTEARSVLDAVKGGADLPFSLIRAALIATGDLDERASRIPPAREYFAEEFGYLQVGTRVVRVPRAHLLAGQTDAREAA
jgi:hypothetical protein